MTALVLAKVAYICPPGSAQRDVWLPLALFIASTYSFLVVMVVSMTTGDLSNILISSLVCISGYVINGHVWGPTEFSHISSINSAFKSTFLPKEQ